MRGGMDNPGRSGTFPASMKPSSPIAIAFREVRHFRPDDCLHVEDIAIRGRLHGWTIPAHRHEGLHQFLLLEQGGATARLDNVPVRIEAPALLMLAPGCVHAFEYGPGCAGRQLTVPTARLADALAGAPLLAARLASTRLLQGDELGDPDTPARHFDALADEFARSDPGRTEVLQAQLVVLASWFLRRLGGTPPDEARRALRDTLVQRFRSLIELHWRRHEGLVFYAEKLHVTPDHLSRSCRQVAGQSALDLLHERVLLEARRLLAYTQAPVAEVARELGFPDPAYFSRFFTRRAGLAPLAYRSALQSGQASGP